METQIVGGMQAKGFDFFSLFSKNIVGVLLKDSVISTQLNSKYTHSCH